MADSATPQVYFLALTEHKGWAIHQHSEVALRHAILHSTPCGFNADATGSDSPANYVVIEAHSTSQPEWRDFLADGFGTAVQRGVITHRKGDALNWTTTWERGESVCRLTALLPGEAKAAALDNLLSQGLRSGSTD
jgi:hypothetical protein